MPATVRPGDLVIARFPARPDLLVVKRAIRAVDGGWWLEGDNPLVTDDSRAFGPGRRRRPGGRPAMAPAGPVVAVVFL